MTTGMLRALERFVLPNACVYCERGVERSHPDALLCKVCRGRMRPLPPGCSRCRQPLPPVGCCRFCADWPQALQWVRSAVWLGPEARAVVHHLKYGGYPALADLAAEVTVRTVPAPPDATALIPIPLTPSRRRVRGYNQAALIASALADRWRVPLDECALRRVRDAPSQTALTPQERAANVAGAFVAVPPCPPPRPRRPATAPDSRVRSPARGSAATIILVDDVLTTGATLAAGAEALRQAGWQAIHAVTFARALPYELRALAG